MKKLFSRVKESKGFTLVEMIVVMAIIGILVALLAPNIATLIKDAQDTSNDAKAKNVMTTLAAYNTKMIKDGYTYVGPIDQDFSGNGADDSGVVIVKSDDFNKVIQELWEDSADEPSEVQFVGKSSGYLPENVLNGTEVMYIYLTKEGNVLGVTYVDANNYVKASNTTLANGDGEINIEDAADTAPLNSSTVRDLQTEDGLEFTLS